LNRRYQITRAAEFESLPVLRGFIDDIGREHPTLFDESTLYDLKLALEEASANIITHGYAGMNPGSLILTLELENDQVRLTLTDFGHPFEPSEAPQPDVEAVMEGKPAGGFGLYFIYQIMDEVDYTATGAGNCLTLVKKLVQRS
jgi:serine/threonine-protein kinase RsbW